MQDHPRVCGNHSKALKAATPRWGSPPRVREPLKATEYGTLYERITPACAGTTFILALLAYSSQDHPRVCGNHLQKSDARRLLLGSPPRVREPPYQRFDIFGRLGITPACAGTTRHYCGAALSSRDHPRVCGNHLPVAPV